MIKRVALLAIIFTLSLSSTPALAAEPGNGMIEGQLVNGTEGGSSVADRDITLKIFLNDAEVSSATTKTGADGEFVFDGLSIGPGYSYQLTLVFQQAEYYGEWLIFSEGETTKSTEVTVYDSTISDKAIKVATAHTIIYVGQGSLQVKEYFLFVNESDRTYIGSKEVAAGTKETLRFSLPDGATELQLAGDLMECCIYDSEDGFIDTMPVFPGAREVAYSYEVNYNSGAYIFSRRVDYPTASYDLLVQGETVQVTSEQLTREEPVFIEETLFNYVSGSEFAPGNILVAQLSNLPETTSQVTVIWVVLTLIVLGVGFGFVYLMKKKSLQPMSPEDSPDQIRQRLLIQLAQLDDDFESGKIEGEAYRKLRAEGKSQLVELMQRAKEESGKR